MRKSTFYFRNTFAILRKYLFFKISYLLSLTFKLIIKSVYAARGIEKLKNVQIYLQKKKLILIHYHSHSFCIAWCKPLNFKDTLTGDNNGADTPINTEKRTAKNL